MRSRARSTAARVTALALLSLAAGAARATDAPHNVAMMGQDCTGCHLLHNAVGPGLTTQASNSNLCLSCHQLKGSAGSTVLNWADADQATSTSTSGSSHSWTGNALAPEKGALVPTSGLQLANGTNLQCSTCHNQHSQANAPFDPTATATTRHFLAASNAGSQLCVACHSLWDQTTSNPGTYYTTGTASFTSGSTAVTGAGGAAFTASMVGWRIKAQAHAASAWGVVRVVNSATSLTLVRPYAGATAAGAAYVLAKTLTHPVGEPQLATSITLVPPHDANGVDQVAGVWGVATGGSGTTLVDASKTFTAALVGQVVRITSGTYKNQTRTLTAASGTTLTWTTTLGGNVTAGTTYEVDADGNLSDNLALVGTTSGTASWTAAGNVECQSCHGVHFADSNAATADNWPPSPVGTGDGNLLRRGPSQTCDGCHPSYLTHSSNTLGTAHGTWGTAFNCLTCHQPHQTGNVFLVRDTIATPNSGNRDVELRAIGGGVEPYGLANSVTPGTGACETCHTDTRNGSQLSGATSTFTAGGTAVTLSSTAGIAANWEVKRTADGPGAWTKVASIGSGTTLTLSVGYKGTTGGANWQAANPRFRNDGSGRGAAGTEHYATSCVGCHPHKNAFAGAGESNGGAACDGCHTDITDRISGTVNTTKATVKPIVSRHRLTSFSSTDSGITWSSPLNTNVAASRSCVNMCHGDHPHDLTSPLVATHEYNAYLDATSGANRGATRTSTTRDNSDFDAAAAGGGMCVSCHQYPVDTGSPVPHPAVTKAGYVGSAHNYTSNSYGTWTYTQHDGGLFQRNCTKCHAERGDGRPGDSSVPFEVVHFSSNPSLLSGNVNPAAAGNVVAENVCYNCHGDGTNGQNLSGKNLYGEVTSAFGHKVNVDAVHATTTESTATANDGKFSGAKRHVNCLDCHDPHEAQPAGAGTGTSGTITSYTANATSGQPDTLNDTSKAWTKNQFKGWTLKMVSGAQAGKASAIYGNGATVASQLLVKFQTAPAVGDRYVIAQSGARVASGMPAGSPALAGATGIQPTFGAPPTPASWNDSGGCGAADSANACEVITAQYGTNTFAFTALSPPPEAYVCMKCHSSFAYGTTLTSFPNSPSGQPNAATGTWSNTAGAAMRESDISADANPANVGHHAIFAKGKNQPLVSSAATTSVRNPNWPSFTTGTVTVSGTTVTLGSGTWPVALVPGWFIYIGSSAPANPSAGWYEVAAVTSDTVLTIDRACAAPSTCTGSPAYFLTAGLGNTFVPPWGPWSVVECSDCHRSSTLSDPLGPHGSTTKWLLRGADTMVFLGQTSQAGTVATVTNTPTDTNNICINCHRRDTYGDYTYIPTPKTPVAGAIYTFSRQNHPADNANGSSASYRTRWGIECMNCHGGARQGAVHGLNLGKGNGGVGGSYSGRRLLAGSSWFAVTRSSTTTAGTCWTKGSTDAVDNCGHSHSGVAFQSGTANYDYESTAAPGTTP